MHGRYTHGRFVKLILGRVTKTPARSVTMSCYCETGREKEEVTTEIVIRTGKV